MVPFPAHVRPLRTARRLLDGDLRSIDAPYTPGDVGWMGVAELPSRLYLLLRCKGELNPPVHLLGEVVGDLMHAPLYCGLVHVH